MRRDVLSQPLAVALLTLCAAWLQGAACTPAERAPVAPPGATPSPNSAQSAHAHDSRVDDGPAAGSRPLRTTGEPDTATAPATVDTGKNLQCPPTFEASTAQPSSCDPKDARSVPCVYKEGVCACESVPYCGGVAPGPEDLSRTAWRCKPTRAPKDCPESVQAGAPCLVPGQRCGASTDRCGWSSITCTCTKGVFAACTSHHVSPPP